MGLQFNIYNNCTDDVNIMLSGGQGWQKKNQLSVLLMTIFMDDFRLLGNGARAKYKLLIQNINNRLDEIYVTWRG